MTIERELLETLCCPVRKSPLGLMPERDITELNAAIQQGRVRYANGTRVAEPLESGLATPDRSSVYGIRDDVPVLLSGLRIVVALPGLDLVEQAPATVTDGVAKVWEEWSERWWRIPPPARPAPDDVTLFERAVEEVFAEGTMMSPRVLLLGVTPEIATMRWPAGTSLLALDASAAMIRKVWPREEVQGAAVARANWMAMPVADATYDFVIGDGVLLWQRYPDAVVALASEVRRVLRDTGAFVMRLFAKPDTDEPIEAVFEDLRRGRIPNSAALHLRVGTALHRDPRSGVRLSDAYEVWHANVPDEEVLLPSLGWPPDMVGTFEVYRGLDTTVSYPTVAELTDLLAAEFRRTVCCLPGYDARGMFPTLVFRPRA